MRYLFVFPGQGSQKVGMGADLFKNFKQARVVFEEASDATALNLKKLCFEGPLEELTKTFHAQPALLTVSVAILRILEAESDLKPTLVAGHSLGEYSALVANGALTLSLAVSLVKKRGGAMQKAVPLGVGSMAAVLGLEPERIEECCEKVNRKDHVVSIANFNAPLQTVISGHKQAVEEESALCKEMGGKSIPLPVSAPFHCELMKGAQEAMKLELEKVKVNSFGISYIANYDAKTHTENNEVKELLVKQICSPVRWVSSMKEAIKNDVEKGFEIGSGTVLTGLMKKIAPEFPIQNISDVESLKKVLNKRSSQQY